MPIGSLVPAVLPLATYVPGQPGGAGGPGGPGPPAPDTGWEIHVLGATSYNQLLAVIPWRMITSLQFARMLITGQANGGTSQGSGTITLNMDDPWWDNLLPNDQPGSYLLDEEHLWQVWQDGVLRHDFFGETITEQLTDPSEQRIVTITGPDTSQALRWAMAAPPGFPDNIVYKLDAITDSFDEINESGDPVLDTGLWNACQNASDITLNPIGSCQLMATSGGTILGTTIFDATQTLISAEVTPTGYYGSTTTLDGSELTQFYIQDISNSSYYAMIALSSNSFYCQFGGSAGVSTKIITTNANYQTVMSNNYGYQYWQITEDSGVFFFWTSPDGENWTQQWSIAHDWAATEVGFYVAATYDDSGTQYATITGINSNVTTSSLSGALYFTEPIMDIYLQTLKAAQARGTIPFITTKMTGSWDSFGNPWTDSQSMQIQNGTDLYTLLQSLTSTINAQAIMNPGFELVVGIPTADGVITIGTDRSAQVVFYDSQGTMSRQRQRVRNSIANLLGVINTDGRTVTASDETSISEWGQREAWIQAAVQVTESDLDIAAEAAVEDTADEILTWTLQITPGLPGREIFTDFNVGDWIGLERPDFSAIDAVQVVGIADAIDQDGAETVELTLLSYLAYIEQQLQYIATKMGGGFVSVDGATAVANNGQITNLNQPTVFAPTLGSIGGVSSGSASSGNPLVYNPVTGQWVPASQPDPVSGNTTGVNVSGSGGTVSIAPDGSTVTVTDPTGVVVTTGVQPDGTVTTTVANSPPPLAPDAPVVIAGAGMLTVAWDGLLGGALPLSDFLNVRINISVTSGFTPAGGTVAQIITGPGVYTIASLPSGTALAAGTTYYVVLQAVNQAGAVSPASTQESGIPLSVSIPPGSISSGQVNFTAADIGGITTYVDPPTPYKWDFTVAAGGSTTTFVCTTSQADNIAATDTFSWSGQSGGAFTVTAVSAPVSGDVTVTFTPAASSVITSGTVYGGDNGDLWFNSASSYQLNQWINGAWTIYQFGSGALAAGTAAGNLTAGEISAAMLAAGVALANIGAAGIASTYLASGAALANIGAGGLTSAYLAAGTALANLSAASITSALLEAGAALSNIGAGGITSTYIAADAIVAGAIAANAVTAGTISAGAVSTAALAAGAVTATQIAANTITAAQIAANTITAALIAANTITAAQIATGTITATQIAAGTITTALIEADAITTSLIAAGAVTATQIAAGTITATQIAAGTITASLIEAGTITAAQIAAGTITATQIEAGTVVSGIVNATTVEASEYVATNMQGEFLAYGGTPGSGNLDTVIAGAAGTDGYSNPYPQGLFSQQLTLETQSSVPTPFSGASIFFSYLGRPRYVSSLGEDSVIHRGSISTANFSVGDTTTPTICSAAATFYGAPVNSDTMIEIEMSGAFHTGTAGNETIVQLYVDGSPFGDQITWTGVVANAWFSTTIRCRVAVVTAGSSGACAVVLDGVCAVEGPTDVIGAAANYSQPLAATTASVALDCTVNHTLQLYGNFNTTTNGSGQQIETYFTRISYYV